MISIPNGWYMVRICMVPTLQISWSGRSQKPQKHHIYKDVECKMERGGMVYLLRCVREKAAFKIMEYLGENYDKVFHLKEYESAWGSGMVVRTGAVVQSAMMDLFALLPGRIRRSEISYAIKIWQRSTLWDTEMARIWALYL